VSELAIIIRHDSRDDVSEEVREKVSDDTRGVAGHVLVLGVFGPLTRRTTPALRDYLRQTISSHQQDSGPHLLLDVSCCTDIDVDGLLTLAVAQNAARSHGGDLRLTDVPPLIAWQLTKHNFDHLFADAEGHDPDHPV
jgi:anti-anti-sigma regulatory factor